MIHRFTSANPVAFDGEYGDENPLFCRHCIMVNPQLQEMSGTDCVVAYYFKDEAEALATMQKGWEGLTLEKFREVFIEEGWKDFMSEDQKAYLDSKGFFYIAIAEEKSNLKPLSQAGAKYLLEEAMRDYCTYKPYEPYEGPHASLSEEESKEQYNEWLYAQHIPYMNQKLGATLANVRHLLSL